MTMGDETSGENQLRPVVQSAKKLYGTIQDLAVQIDSLSSRCLEVEDLFSHDLQSKRLAVKDCCESLFNLSPKTYGAVAREKLWRLALYDAVNRARRIQRDRQWTPGQLDLVKTHLQSGIGTLQMYIIKLKALCESSKDPVLVRAGDIDGLIDGVVGSKLDDPATSGSLERSWITDLVHLCVINIGDLYRYLKEMHTKAIDEDLVFYANFYLSGAQKQYSLAFLLRPDSGLAFNQLGNLFCDSKGGLQSAYYLLYSIQSTNAYEGAYANLRQLLDRKIVQFARLPASIEPKPMETLVNNIQSLMYYFLYENTHLQNYERHCQEALRNFSERLVTCDPEMDEKFFFHLASICVMVVWRLQSINSVHTSAAVAFAISVFCQLINHLTGILEEHAHLLQIISIPGSPTPSDEGKASDAGKEDEESQLLNGEEKVGLDPEINKGESKFIVPRRRKRVRRVRADSESDSDMSNMGTPDFLYSDDEEMENSEDNWSDDDDVDFNDSNDDDDEKLSQRDGSEFSFKIEGEIKAFDSSSSNGHSDASGSGRRGKESAPEDKNIITDGPDLADNGQLPLLESEAKEKLAMDWEDLSKCRAQVEALLVALTPFMRWIQATPVIKDALAANAEKAFLEKLCSALNLLLSENWPDALDGVELKEMKDDWNALCEGSIEEKKLFKWELDEDRSMLGIPQLHEFVKDSAVKAISGMDSLIIRMGRLISFGLWIVSTESFSVLYSKEEMNFFVPTPQTLKAYLLDAKMKRLKERLGARKSDDLDKLSRAYKEMKLKSDDDRRRRRGSGNHRDQDREENSNRRRRFRRRKGPPCKEPIYAVVDLEAILNRFRDVKRIAAHKKFIVVVPNSVWKTLDMLKDSNDDDSINARTAFRWLEAAFARKHPGFVLHKDQHKSKIGFPYPKDPVDVDAWEYYDMMEYCNYIMTTIQKNNHPKSRSSEAIWGDVRDKCRVFFLTGHEDLLNTKLPRSFDPVKIARNVGIYVDYVAPYPGLGRGKKWKSVAKSNG